MLDEERGEDSTDRAQTAEEGCSNAVEAHARDGGLCTLPAHVTGEEEHRGAEACQRTGNDKGEDDVAVLRHAGVFGCILVAAGGLELIAELGFAEENAYGDGNENSKRNGDGDILVFVKELVQPGIREKGGWVNILNIHGIRASDFFYLCKQCICGIEGNPVEHDAGNDLVNIAAGLEEANNGTETSTGYQSEDHARQPAPAPGESGIETCTGACHILPGNADVKEADFIGEENAQRAHEKGHCFGKGITELLELFIRPAPGEEVFDNIDDGFGCTFRVNKEEDDVADQQAENDADYGSDKGLHTGVLQGFFHAFTSSLFAPAM